jgi:RAB6A-GEF complex partner protein 1
VKYDMQIFADRIEFCWTHLRGIGALENSLWGYDGQGLRVWLNALAIESPRPDNPSYPYENIKESANIPLDFYPLCMLAFKTGRTWDQPDCAIIYSGPHGQGHHHRR